RPRPSPAKPITVQASFKSNSEIPHIPVGSPVPTIRAAGLLGLRAILLAVPGLTCLIRDAALRARSRPAVQEQNVACALQDEECLKPARFQKKHPKKKKRYLNFVCPFF